MKFFSGKWNFWANSKHVFSLLVVKVLLVLRLQNLAFLKIPSKTPLCCSCSSRPLLLLQVMYLELSTTQVVAKVKDTDLVVRQWPILYTLQNFYPNIQQYVSEFILKRSIIYVSESIFKSSILFVLKHSVICFWIYIQTSGNMFLNSV